MTLIQFLQCMILFRYLNLKSLKIIARYNLKKGRQSYNNPKVEYKIFKDKNLLLKMLSTLYFINMNS